MVTFAANTVDLKRTLSIVALSVGKINNHIQSHALFSIIGERCNVSSTDEDRVSDSTLTLTAVDGGDTQFTADPKNLLKILSSTDLEETQFSYDSMEKTLKIYTSRTKKAFLSFASFDPDKFLSLSVATLELKHTITKEIFLDGIKFAQGFVDEKSEKFSNIFLTEGVLYSGNGNSRAAAFSSPDLIGAPNLIIRKAVLTSIASMVEKAGLTEIAIKTSDKLIAFSSTDDLHCFGFRNSTSPTVNFPIKTTAPDMPYFNIDRILFTKKLNRLSLTSENVGIKMIIKDGENLEMLTVGERPSFEIVPCVCDSKEPVEFIIQCNPFKAVLSQFKASNIDIYIAKNKCTLLSSANIEITEEGSDVPVMKPFTAVSVMALARLIK